MTAIRLKDVKLDHPGLGKNATLPGSSLQKKNRQQRTNIYCNIQLIELMNELIVRVLLLPELQSRRAGSRRVGPVGRGPRLCSETYGSGSSG